MSTSLRISSFTGVLLAAYFIPTWSIIAFRIIMSPIHGFFERPNISIAIFIGDHLHLAGTGMVRAAWLLALGRIMVVAFFAVFVVFLSRPAIRKAGAADEMLALALTIGSLISFTAMAMASEVGELAARQLHATELLMLLGTAIVFLVERPERSQADQGAGTDRLALEQPQLLDNR
jgi:hypothetical protein